MPHSPAQFVTALKRRWAKNYKHLRNLSKNTYDSQSPTNHAFKETVDFSYKENRVRNIHFGNMIQTDIFHCDKLLLFFHATYQHGPAIVAPVQSRYSNYRGETKKWIRSTTGKLACEWRDLLFRCDRQTSWNMIYPFTAHLFRWIIWTCSIKYVMYYTLRAIPLCRSRMLTAHWHICTKSVYRYYSPSSWRWQMNKINYLQSIIEIYSLIQFIIINDHTLPLVMLIYLTLEYSSNLLLSTLSYSCNLNKSLTQCSFWST